jgi:hypothetical protein
VDQSIHRPLLEVKTSARYATLMKTEARPVKCCKLTVHGISREHHAVALDTVYDKLKSKVTLRMRERRRPPKFLCFKIVFRSETFRPFGDLDSKIVAYIEGQRQDCEF